MNAERPNQLFPVSRRALEQAFPSYPDKDRIQQAMRQEALDMGKNSPHVLRLTQQKFSHEFSTGIKIMHRILRHEEKPLPFISPTSLSIYDMEQERAIIDRGKGSKEYFVNKWMKDFQGKPDNAELANTISKVGEIWTNRNIEDIWGGASYIAGAFERQIKVNEANTLFPDAARHMKKNFSTFFTE